MSRVMRASNSRPRASIKRPAQHSNPAQASSAPASKKRKAEVFAISDDKDEVIVISDDKDDEEVMDDQAVLAAATAAFSRAHPETLQPHKAKRAPRKRAPKKHVTSETAAPIPASAKPDRIREVHVKPFTTFHCFKDLSVELRLKIWGMAADADTAWIIQTDPEPSTAHRKTFSVIRTGRPVPALLHVCQESRAECIEDDPLNLNDQDRQAKEELKKKVAAAAERGAKTYNEALKMIAEDDAAAAAGAVGQPELVKKELHAKWKLYKWDNSTNSYLHPPKLHIYFSATNDTFWGGFYRGSWNAALSAPMAASVRHFASGGAVKTLNDLATVKERFPHLQTATCFANDYLRFNVPWYDDICHTCEYLELRPEVGGQFDLTHLAQEHYAGLRTMQLTAGRPAPPRSPFWSFLRATWYLAYRGAWAGGYGSWERGEVPQFTEQETEELTKMLRFRFEVQAVQNEIPEFRNKLKYRR